MAVKSELETEEVVSVSGTISLDKSVLSATSPRTPSPVGSVIWVLKSGTSPFWAAMSSAFPRLTRAAGSLTGMAAALARMPMRRTMAVILTILTKQVKIVRCREVFVR